MAAGTFSRRSQQARRAAACIQCAERLFWCAVWVWFGIRTFRLAHRILVCRKFSRACCRAARCGQSLERLQW